jgi:hypothetical protein
MFSNVVDDFLVTNHLEVESASWDLASVMLWLAHQLTEGESYRSGDSAEGSNEAFGFRFDRWRRSARDLRILLDWRRRREFTTWSPYLLASFTLLVRPAWASRFRHDVTPSHWMEIS